jgi:hypothetical protein
MPGEQFVASTSMLAGSQRPSTEGIDFIAFLYRRVAEAAGLPLTNFRQPDGEDGFSFPSGLMRFRDDPGDSPACSLPRMLRQAHQNWRLRYEDLPLMLEDRKP